MLALYILLALLLLLVLVLVVNTLRCGTKTGGGQPGALPPREKVDHYADTLSQMIACNTVTVQPGGDMSPIYAMHQKLEELFPLIHQKLEKHDIDGALLFKWAGKDPSRPPILLMSHMDVVPATGDWKYPPFAGTIAEGKIWGRGAVDTKGSLCGILNAVEELLGEDFAPAGDVYIASSCNEEISGYGAPKTVAYLKEQGVHLGLVMDEGGAVVDPPLPGIQNKFCMLGLMEKGMANLRFTARSHGGHASTPPKNTPLARLAAMVDYVEKKEPFTKRFTPPVEGMFREMAPYMPFGYKLIFANLWLFRPLLLKILPRASAQAGAMLQTTCAFTMASGSDAPNVIPETAGITANLRYMSHEPEALAIKKARDFAAKFDCEAEVLTSSDCSGTADINSPYYAHVCDTLHTVFPEAGVAPYVMLQGSDSRHYEAICDCVLRFAPLDISKQQLGSIHGLDENLDVEALARAVAFYRTLIETCR
ncbi:Probable succinyl-diaminopimelate desuccinylase [Anaerotruncus sp. 2789STDY5834896]|uniref:Probable succinyl-diaminopimelate desuccinylase n=1 Tax=uncultured Anaerotruncus sp. TaxID=905011 RepID=A0A1C6GF30_9FIRM|nr:Probable succinyl-diaminopimelate desuccinylase [uncultured Anaerotruncus sp.]